MKNNILETSDLLLKKAVFDDWQALYRNIWSHEESTRHMMWKVVVTGEEA